MARAARRRSRQERAITAEPQPAGVAGRIPYLPALDGLRAVALVAVLCFHGGFSWMSGGYLPLSSFFVLSGFLITALLLCERGRHGRIDLRAFWGRRARRLVPGIVITFGLIALYLGFGADGEAPGVVGDGLSALGWVTNWRFILSDRAYADAFADPSPFQHFWSLAVEEQFYLVVPVLAAALLALRRGRRWPLAVVVGSLTVASVVAMRAVHQPGDAPLRAYFGTDTRAAELLIGVLLALVLVGATGLRRLRGPGRVALDLAGAGALVATIVSWFVVREFDDRLYEGGLLLIALLAALVVASATQPGSVVARVLALRPLPAIGRISYGAYLYHWPLFLWFTEERVGLSGAALFAFRLAITFSLAAVSYRFVERPIIEGRLPGRVAVVSWANATTMALALVVAAAATLPASGITLRVGDADAAPRLVSPTTTTTTTSVTASPATADPAAEIAAAAPTTSGTGSVPPPEGSSGPGRSAAGPGTGPAEPSHDEGPAPPRVPPPGPPLRVMVVGDSIGQNLANGLAAWIGAHGQLSLFDATRVACGLSRDATFRHPDGSTISSFAECASWPRDFARHVGSFDPEVVVIHTGVGELLDRQVPGTDQFAAPGVPAFDDQMLAEQAQAAEILGRGGATVLWTTSPCTEDFLYFGGYDAVDGNRRIDHLNTAILPRLAAIRPVEIIDLAGQLCPGGGFSSTVAGVDGARPDGVHLTDAAAHALAERWLAPLVLRAGGRA